MGDITLRARRPHGRGCEALWNIEMSIGQYSFEEYLSVVSLFTDTPRPVWWRVGSWWTLPLAACEWGVV